MLTSSSPAAQVQRIIDSYELVKADSDYKPKIVWYFDTFDVVKILQGYFAYDYGNRFDKESFISSNDLYVHCFASKGWLDKIRLLSPHQEEMISKIDRLFKSPVPAIPEISVNDLLPDLKLTRLMKAFKGLLAQSETKKYAQELRKDAGLLFKISSILEMPTWFERYRKLIRETQIITFEQDANDQANLAKKDIYKIVRKAINAQRGYDRYEKNNHMDALALTILHEKLKEAEEDSSKPIPVFYSSHPVIKRAIKTIQETDQKLFAYHYRGKHYSIIREADYFIIDQIINFEQDKKPVEFFDQMTDLKSTIERIYQNYKLKKEITGSEFKDFKDDINTTVLNEFLHYVWLEQDGIQNLGESIENRIKFQENKAQVERFFVQERNAFNKQYEKPIRVSRLSTNLWKSLPDSLRRFAKEYNEFIYQANFDIFLTYGLLRFGLDKPTLEPIIQGKFDSIFLSIQKIEAVEKQRSVSENGNNDRDQTAEQDFLFEVSNMISELISGISTGKQDEHFVANLGILWMLEELDLIVQLCDMLEYNYTYYQIAFLHSAAITLNSLGRRDSVTKITKMVEKNLEKAPNHPYYNIWIGLAFTRFNMWIMQAGRPILPELGEIDYKSDHYNNYLKSITLLKMAIEYLNEGKDADPSKFQRKKQKYFYALNNLIYYTTKGGSPQDFEDLTKPVEDFSAFESVRNIWQNRFYDTLAWFYYRKALLHLAKEEINIFKYYFNLAEKKNAIALEQPFSRREKGISEKLKERLDRTKAENAAVFKES